jgi:hypothetical protein
MTHIPYSQVIRGKLIARRAIMTKLFTLFSVQELSLHRNLLIFRHRIMQKFTITRRYVLRLLLIFLVSYLTLPPQAFGQVTIRGGSFAIKGSNAIFSCQRLYVAGGAALTNEGSLYVSDTFGIRNGTSTFNNSGNFYVDKAAVFDTATMTHTGDMYISTALKIRISPTDLAILNSSTGNLTLYQTGIKNVRTNDLGQVDFNKLTMATTGQNNTFFGSSINVDSLVLTNGKIRMALVGEDSLTVNQGGVILGGNLRSYTDSLYRVPTASGTNLYFPVGNTAVNNTFRPIELLNITYSGFDPELNVVYGNSVVSSYDSVGLNEVDFTNFWRVRDGLGSMTSFVARPSYRDGDVSVTGDAVVAQTENNPNMIFYNLGRASVTNSGDSTAIQAELNSPNDVILAVGQATRINLNISAFLGGALLGVTGTMQNLLYSNILTTLQARFEAGGTAKYPMLPTYAIPTNAVDSIKIYLRTGIPASTTIDSISAWLMPDGTIRDFESGTKDYVSFANAPVGSYYVVVTHRNHLAIMSTSTVALNTSIPGGTQVDLGNIANVYGAGAGDNGVVAFMWEGNANYDREVNAADLAKVQQGYNTFLGDTDNILGYRNRDVDMTDNPVQISAGDYTRVINGNSWIYFSAVPGI